MRNRRVVLGNVERNVTPDRRGRVESVKGKRPTHLSITHKYSPDPERPVPC